MKIIDGESRGLSVWLFSKVVMFIFLFLTFASILSFMNIVSSRTSADAAEVLAMQITEAVQTVVVTPSINSEIVVPLPRTLPERESAGSRAKQYTVHVRKPVTPSTMLAVAIGWGNEPSIYAAASSTELGILVLKNDDDINIFSQDFRYVVINKIGSSICIQKCEGISPRECEPGDATTCR